MSITSPTRAARHAKTALDSVPDDFDADAHLINDAENIEALAYGFGIPPEHVLTQLRRLWWLLTQHGLRLPAERRVILIAQSMI